MIYVTGDMHGDWVHRLNMDSFPEQKEMTKEDYVIICGDFGIWNNSSKENINLKWLDARNFTTLFVDGNHENYDVLDSFEIKKWHGGNVHFIKPSVIHLTRGQVFNIDNKLIFSFGGAASHDIRDGILDKNDPKIKRWKKDNSKEFRINHVSWWKSEMPNEEEMYEGRENLRKVEDKIDFVISHCAPSSTQAIMSCGVYKPDKLTQYFEGIKAFIDYNKWFFGHYHRDQQITNKEICLFKQIIRIA